MSTICNYKILPELKLVIGKYSGQVSEGDIISLKGEIKKNDDFNWGFNEHTDFQYPAFCFKLDWRFRKEH